MVQDPKKRGRPSARAKVMQAEVKTAQPKGQGGRAAAASGPRWGGEVFLDKEAERKKHAILRTAAALFREHGFEHTHLTAISDALNLTKPSLYYYVGNKEEILVSIQRYGAEQMLRGFDELDTGDRTGAELLTILMTRYGDWVTTEFGACVVRLFDVKTSPENAKSIQLARNKLTEKVISLLERGIGDGSIKPCNPRLVSLALFGMLNWMAYWYDRSRARLPPGDIAAMYIDHFLKGIGSEGAAGAKRPRTRST
jgi:AcrR family transcriptional regulator